MRTPTYYEIRIEGHLGSSWSSWFEGLAIHHGDNGETVLCGPLADQAALHGVLMKIRDLGLPLVAVRKVGQTDARVSTCQETEEEPE
jgi:hypothetical protein